MAYATLRYWITLRYGSILAKTTLRNYATLYFSTTELRYFSYGYGKKYIVLRYWCYGKNISYYDIKIVFPIYNLIKVNRSCAWNEIKSLFSCKPNILNRKYATCIFRQIQCVGIFRSPASHPLPSVPSWGLTKAAARIFGHGTKIRIFFVVRYDTLNFGVVRYGIPSATLRFISRATATEKWFRNVT